MKSGHKFTRAMRRWRWIGSVLLLAAGVGIVWAAFDAVVIGRTWAAMIGQPLVTAAVLAVYALAFAIRAALWVRVLPGLPFGHALAGVHVALGGNHVLPLRLGEVLRVTSAVRRAGIEPSSALASTVTLRAADLLAVGLLVAVLGPALATRLLGSWVWPVVVVVFVAGAGGLWLLARRRWTAPETIRLPGLLVVAGAVAAWMLEATVMWQAAVWAGLSLSPRDALLVTAVTIGAQVVAITPGGFGTYEAAATAALVALGAPAGAALAAALSAHAVKTLYALASGALAVFVPAPSMFGRLRLPKLAVSRPGMTISDGPVVLLMPAHDEVAAVGSVIARVPATVCGRPVRCLVIDDGSSDGTGEAARTAGAEVITQPTNLGLGAAVRRGLAEAAASGASVVAFCDADGEYAPEELERLVKPILHGEADYVAGSRFAGDIRFMHLHRRLGNRLLTALLRIIARRPISDGQTGYRALSAAAAADAEVVHDFNYAQVLTLDLIAKGWRYSEVPITYAFRTTGRSFVRLGGYLRAVLPAVHRELNATGGEGQSSTTWVANRRLAAAQAAASNESPAPSASTAS